MALAFRHTHRIQSELVRLKGHRQPFSRGHFLLGHNLLPVEPAQPVAQLVDGVGTVFGHY